MLRLLATFLLPAALTFPHGAATIRTPSRAVNVRVEIARTPAQLHRGLMGRRSLAPDAGMAFVFRSDTRSPFWMKDTLIPLSIAFWDGRGRIVRILDMTPCRADPCRMYDPRASYRGALEVNRGAFRRWGVNRGDRVTISR